VTFQTWIEFVGASAVIGIIPGPGVMSIVGYAVGSGRRTALAAVAGMAIGNSLAMSLSLAGLGALLASSAIIFAIVKWLGALYLVALGIRSIRSSFKASASESFNYEIVSPALALRQTALVGIFHPKTIVFFIPFVPQFVNMHESYLSQSTALVASFVCVVAMSDTAYALVGSYASGELRKPKTFKWAERASGSVLIAAGLVTVSSRNS